MLAAYPPTGKDRVGSITSPLSGSQSCEFALVGPEGLKDGIEKAALEYAVCLAAAVAVTSAALNHGLGAGCQ